VPEGIVGIFCFEIHQTAAARKSSEIVVEAIRMMRLRRDGATAASTS